MKMHWIKCSDRFPIIENNIKVSVLVTTSWSLVTVAQYYGDHWEIDDISYKLTAVIAWMPLPEAYYEL